MTYVTPEGLSIQSIRSLEQDWTAYYDDLTGVRATVEALDEQGGRVAAVVTPLHDELTEVELDLDQTDLHIRVVDAEGSPLPGTTIRLLAPELGVGWIHQVVSDAVGEYRFRALGVDRVFANLSHPDRGVRSGIEIAVAEAAGDTVTLELDAPARLRLRLLDGAEPLAGVQVRFFDARCKFEFGTFATDADGVAVSGQVALGDYRVVVIHPGLWPTEQIVTASTGNGEIDIQVPRLGSAEFHVRSAGLALAGANVVLVHEESGTTSTDWLANGAVNLAESSEPRTNPDGVLRFDGLPRGTYQWVVEAAGFTQTSGSCAVQGRQTAVVEAALIRADG